MSAKYKLFDTLRSRLRRVPRLSTLRGRYFYAAIVLVAILIAVSLIGRHLVHDASDSQVTRIQQRGEASDALLDFSQQARALETHLLRFLHDPSVQHRQAIDDSISRSLAAAGKLRQVEWVMRHSTLTHLSAVLEKETQRLDTALRRLAEIRTDVRQWLPAMGEMLDKMLPSRQAFMTAADLAITEGNEQTDRRQNPQILSAFNTVRYLWTRMTSEFRLYVSNRFGVFTVQPDAGMQTRFKNIVSFQESVRALLKELKGFQSMGVLSFVEEEAVPQMLEHNALWYASFERVARNLVTDTWRQDTVMMRNVIDPLFVRIQTRLSTMQLELGVASAKDVDVLTGVAGRLSNIMILLAVGVILIIAFSSRVFDRAVLQPIAQIAKALKDEARGEPKVRIPRSGSEETQDLIEAFKELRRQVHQREAHLDHIAHHDSLTNLPNRALLKDRLDQALVRGQREEHIVGLLFLDLDNFKNINDTLGHDVGDQLLVAVGERLSAAVRESDTVARLGGDEFMIIMEGVVHVDQVARVAEKTLRTLDEPMIIGGHELHVTASIGIALSPFDDRVSDELIKGADTAMYYAKADGRNNYRFYSAEMTTRVKEHLRMETELRQGMERQEFFLNFQPQVDFKTGAVTSVEALLRWERPGQGPVSPVEFVPVMENNGLIVPVGAWVLETACRQAEAWRCAGFEFERISVNISGRQLRKQDALLKTVVRCLRDTGLPPTMLELEVTEGMLIDNVERTARLFSDLANMGVQLTVDDFGTGYSSLSYLKKFAIHNLKIDQSFVRDIISDSNDAAIVEAILAMARALNLHVVAEGVETQAQFEWLRQRGCNAAQGFLIARPGDADTLAVFINRDKPAVVHNLK